MIKTLAKDWPQPPAGLRYALAIVSVVAASIATQVVDVSHAVTLPAICAVLITAWYGGIGPGLLAWLLSVLAIGYFVTSATLASNGDFEHLPAFLWFSATALIVVWLGAMQRSTAMSLRRTRDELDARNQDLETTKAALQTEIAKRVRIEASLHAGEARLNALAGSTDEIAFEFDAKGTYLNVWTSNEHLLFRPRHELIGRTLAEIFDEEWSRVHVERLRRVLASGEPESWEYRIDLPTGRSWFLGRMTPMPSLDGARRTIACLVRDITEQKRDAQSRVAQSCAMRALAEAESLAAAAPRMLSAIGDNMEWAWGALWIVDREHTLLQCETLWHAANFEAAEFDSVSREMALKPGEGRPGRVWESGQPEWMLNVTEDPAFLRRDAAARAGLHSGVAFPVLDLHSLKSLDADRPSADAPAFAPGTGTVEIAGLTSWQAIGGEVLGIIEFFSRDLRERDEDQLAMLTVIGSQIGQFIKRKRAESEVRRSEKELRDIIETIPAMVWTALPDGHVDFISQRWREFTGLSPEESLGWNWEPAMHPEEHEGYVTTWRESLATGQPFEAELRLRRPTDGEYRWFSERAVPLRDEHGNIRKWYGFIVDIEARKRAEYLTGQVFHSSPDGISIVGRDYRYQRVNPVYERNWSMPAETIVGKHVADLLGTQVFEQTIKPNLDRCFAGEEVSYGEWFSNSLGRHYLVVTYSPLRPAWERVEAAIVVTRDLTDHMLASEALRAAQAELAHVNRVTTMGQLTASIAHEVNQPISATVTNAQAALRWLAADPPDMDEVRQALGRISENGKRAGEVIGRIRALIKKVPARKDRLDINEAILDIVALTRSEALRDGVSLHTQLATGLPCVEGDRVQLQQVILNLVMNAIEAMSGIDEAPRELLINTGLDVAGDVLVSVRDSGPGLQNQNVDRLFEAFYTTKPAGMGMGLAICRSIIEAHGGRMWASANEPRGAVFQFTIATEREETVAAEPAGASST